jgi:hypothetical protein
VMIQTERMWRHACLSLMLMGLNGLGRRR